MIDTETIQLAVAGIATEKQALTARLGYLNKKEAELRQAGVLGTSPTKAKTARKTAAKATGVVPTSKREVSEATRQKMRDSQRRRHRKATAGETVPPPYIPTVGSSDPRPVAAVLTDDGIEPAAIRL